MAARAKSRAAALRPRRGQVYKVGRRRVRIVSVEGLDKRHEWNGKHSPSAKWIFVGKDGRKRYGAIERDGWKIRLTVTRNGKTETRTGRTFLRFDAGGACIMPPHYELEGEL